MAGAAVIAAVTNALEGREFPFVFGGDGASFAVSPGRSGAGARGAGGDRDLGRAKISTSSMRVALVPMQAIRAQGLDVRVARFGAVAESCPMRCFPAAGLAGPRPR